MPAGVIRWRPAVAYGFTGPAPQPPVGQAEIAIFNRDYLPDFSGLPALRANRYLELFKSQPYCAGVIVKDAFVSVCFHHGNGAVTVETAPEFRRRGYALSCLRVVTARTIRAGIAPRYGTEEGNTASRRTAERAGYRLDLRMFWVTVDAENRATLPPTMEFDYLR